MLISREGQQKLEQLHRAGQGGQIQQLVQSGDAKGLEAKGLSRLDALALLQVAADQGINAVFALFDANKALNTQSDGSAGSHRAAFDLVNKLPGKNNPMMQRMSLVRDVKAERAQQGAIELLTKTLGAQVSIDPLFGLTEAQLRLPPGQLDKAVSVLKSLVGDKAALEAALGEAGWSLEARFKEPKTDKTTYFDTGPSTGAGAVRMRQISGDTPTFSFKPNLKGGTVSPRLEIGLSQSKAPEIDLRSLLADIAKSATKLAPSQTLERTLVSFKLQHEDGRNTIIDLESQKLSPRGGGAAKREDTLELSGTKAELPLWPALLKALGVQGEPQVPVASKGLAAAKALGLLE